VALTRSLRFIYHFPFDIFQLVIGLGSLTWTKPKWKMENDKWKMINVWD